MFEFREFGNECSGGLRSDALGGPEKFVGLVPDGAVLQPLVEFAVDVLELPFQRFEDRLDAGFDLGVAGLLLSVEFGGPPVDELASSGERLRQFAGVFVRQRPDRWSDGEAKVSQDASIQGVGLGELSGRFGEVPRLPQVDDDDGQLGGNPFGDEQLFESSGGLDHDEAGRALLELFAEGFDPSGGVRESQRVLGGELVEIELLRGDINAHGKRSWSTSGATEAGTDVGELAVR